MQNFVESLIIFVSLMLNAEQCMRAVLIAEASNVLSAKNTTTN